jgi:hypothetical protein
VILSPGRASIDRITELVYMGSRIKRRKDFFPRTRGCGRRWT